MSKHYRWIMYLQQPMPSGSFALDRVQSFREARKRLVEYGRETGFHQDLTVYGSYGPTATLYPYDRQSWKDAKEFEDVGNPFDYPSYLVESQEDGSVKVIPA